MKEDYQDKFIIVVGGSSGIGLAVAKMLATKGAKICLLARNELQLRAAGEQIAAQTGVSQRQIYYHSIDVRDAPQTTALIEQIVGTKGCPDMVLNFAGKAQPDEFANISAEQFMQTLQLNVLGARNIAAAVVPHFKRRGGGKLLFTSSIAGFIGTYGYTDYCASKFAIVGFASALAQEVAQHNIEISILYPPDTKTPGFDAEEKNKPLATKAVSSGNKIMTAEQVASALLKQLNTNKRHIFASKEGYFTYLLQRFAPFLVNFYMLRIIKRTLARNNKN